MTLVVPQNQLLAVPIDPETVHGLICINAITRENGSHKRNPQWWGATSTSEAPLKAARRNARVNSRGSYALAVDIRNEGLV